MLEKSAGLCFPHGVPERVCPRVAPGGLSGSSLPEDVRWPSDCSRSVPFCCEQACKDEFVLAGLKRYISDPVVGLVANTARVRAGRED